MSLPIEFSLCNSIVPDCAWFYCLRVSIVLAVHFEDIFTDTSKYARLNTTIKRTSDVLYNRFQAGGTALLSRPDSEERSVEKLEDSISETTKAPAALEVNDVALLRVAWGSKRSSRSWKIPRRDLRGIREIPKSPVHARDRREPSWPLIHRSGSRDRTLTILVPYEIVRSRIEYKSIGVQAADRVVQ